MSPRLSPGAYRTGDAGAHALVAARATGRFGVIGDSQLREACVEREEAGCR